MPGIKFHPHFHREHTKFIKHDEKLRFKIKETLTRFAVNPAHPSLHLEKLSGTEIWTVRIDRGNRLFFIWNDKGDTAIFFNVGKHDLYRNL